MASGPGRLTLITGSPRSSTTAFHNALIAGGIYRGIMGDDMIGRDPDIDRNLYTDEYYPSMQLAIACTSSNSPPDKARLKQQLLAQVTSLGNAFAGDNGLMLKAPHYVFGIPAYADAYGEALRLIYIHRSPFSIAASMLKHPHISGQLTRGIWQCTDFTEFDLPRNYAEHDVLTFATGQWQTLALFERALFVWYLYANAFLRNIAAGGVKFLVVCNEAFDHGSSLKIADFLGVSSENASKIESGYRALPAATSTPSSLSADGQRLWGLIRRADIELTALAQHG